MTILPSHRSTLEEGRVSKCGGQKFAALAVLNTARNCIIGTSSFTVLLHRAIVGGTYSGEAVIFGHNIGSLSPCRGTNIRAAGSFFGLLFFVFPLLAFFTNVMSGLTFGWVAEKIVCECFRSVPYSTKIFNGTAPRIERPHYSYLTSLATQIHWLACLVQSLGRFSQYLSIYSPASF